MSIELMNAAFVAIMPPAEKLVALKLCDCANDNGVAWPSIAKLAEAACISQRQVQRIVKRLTAQGYLELVGNENGGAGNARVYRVVKTRFSTAFEAEKGDKLSPKKGRQNVMGDNLSGVTSETQKGDIDDQKGDIAMSQKGDTAMSPESLRTTILKSNHQGTTILPATVETVTGELVDEVVEERSDETALQAACRATWVAYAGAFQDRYNTQPVRNAMINASVKAFVQRIGFEEAPKVAEFFVWINDQFLVRNTHGFQLLTKSAESYRTQWATGKAITATSARQIDKTQSNRSAAEEAKEIIRRRQETGQAYRSTVAEEAIEINRKRNGGAR